MTISKQKVAILRVLREAGGNASSAEIAAQLRSFAIELSPRAIRVYLQELEDDGLVQPARRGRTGGRTITPRGLREINDARVMDRVGLTSARIDELAFRMNFNPDLAHPAGLVVLNMTFVAQDDFGAAVAEMVPVFDAGLAMGDHVALFRPGENAGAFQVPAGRVGIGTVCSVTVNGVLLNGRIPTLSRFAGVLELHGGRPTRFTDVIAYEGTSLDPLEVFIKSGLTGVRDAARTGNGRITASFREIPGYAAGEAEKLLLRMRAVGLNGLLMMGKPNQPLLGIAPQEGRAAMIIVGGLNPCAAFQEAGVRAEDTAMAQLTEYRCLRRYHELALEAGVTPRR
jgi:HTH-type transcriptional regulator, global nitrogen regulator NrpRI